MLAYDPRNPPWHYYELNIPFFYLPGGHVEFKESASQAVVRELNEETGYRAQPKRFLGFIEHSWSFSGDDVCCHTHEINLIFEVDVPGLNSSSAVGQKEEHVAFKWVSLRDLDTIDLRPTPLKLIIPEWLAQEKNEFYNNYCNYMEPSK